MMRRVWAVLLALLVLCTLAPTLVSAHAELVSSDPEDGALLAEAPARVRLSFSEPIEPDFFALEVYAPDRTRVDQNNARVSADNIAALEVDLRPLPQGTYTVSWRVMSIDSHIVQGTFAFAVGTSTATSAALDIQTRGAPFELDAFVRWITFLLSFVLVGSLAFLPLAFWPAWDAAKIVDGMSSQRVERTIIRLAWFALVALFVTSLGALLIQAANASGVTLGEVFGGRAVSRLLLGTKYGILWLCRIACLIGLLAAIAWASVGMRVSRRLAFVGIAIGALLLLAIAASGHASSVVRRTTLTILADWMHLVAGGIWTGGLLQLILVVPVVRAVADADQRRRLLAGMVQRFSWTAGASVSALIGTGVYAGLVHVPTLRSLGYTAYGAALSGKLLLMLFLLGVGAVNLLVMHPRFVRMASGKGVATEDQNRRTFRRLVVGEMLLVMLVLGVTGVLTGLPPATTAPGTGLPFSATHNANDLRVTLSTTPNQAGTNQIEAVVLDAAGQPVDVPQVTLTLKHLDMVMDARQAILKPTGDGRYAAEGNYLNMAGRWDGSLAVPGDFASATFQWTVGELPTRAPVFSPGLIALNAATPIAAMGLMAFALAALVFYKRSGWQRVRDRRQAIWIGGLLIVLGTLVTGNTLATAYRRTLPNPVPATVENIAQGKQLYVQNCAVCHGLTGRGDGPGGARLNPRPADFQVHMREGHTDPQLFSWVTTGVDGTGMPAFKERLTEDQIWTVINFIHTFAPQQP